MRLNIEFNEMEIVAKICRVDLLKKEREGGEGEEARKQRYPERYFREMETFKSGMADSGRWPEVISRYIYFSSKKVFSVNPP